MSKMPGALVQPGPRRKSSRRPSRLECERTREWRRDLHTLCVEAQKRGEIGCTDFQHTGWLMSDHRSMLHRKGRICWT